jgi:hypothetical protein
MQTLLQLLADPRGPRLDPVEMQEGELGERFGAGVLADRLVDRAPVAQRRREKEVPIAVRTDAPFAEELVLARLVEEWREPGFARFAPIGIAQRTREHRIDAPRLGWRRLLRIEPGAADDPALLEREMLHHLEHVRLARAVVPEHRERAAAFADVEHPLEGVDLAVAPHRVGKQPLHRHDAEPQGFEHLPLFALLVGELRSDGHALLLAAFLRLDLRGLGAAIAPSVSASRSSRAGMLIASPGY